MKKLLKTVAMAVLSIAMMAGFASCADQDVAPESVSTRAVTETLPQIITGIKTLNKGITYIVDGKVYVGSKTATGKLVIPAGTRIEGVAKADNKDASALVITTNGTIEAKGTAAEPIIMTAQNQTKGGWGGLVVLGKGIINQSAAQQIEGIDASVVPITVDATYGTPGTNMTDAQIDAANAADYKGILQYVRVEFAGAEISDTNELNAFTFGGVGRMVMDHCQAYKGADDAFEFFGGAVNAKYLVSTATDDDAFDFDFGYRGKIQFAVSTIDPAMTYSKDPNGIECDNDGASSANQPFTNPVLSNLTIIGTSTGKAAKTGMPDGVSLKSAANFRRNTRFTLVNSVLYGFPKGVLKETTNSFILKTNVVNSVPAGNEFVTFTPDASNVIAPAPTETDLGIYQPFTPYVVGALRPFKAPSLTGANFTGLDMTFFTSTTYKGAVTPATNWLMETWVKK